MGTGLYALPWLFLTVSSSLASPTTSPLAECSRWSAASLGDYAQAADVRFNRDRQGRPILFGLTLAVSLIRQERWSDAAYGLIGFDHPFWMIPSRGGERVPAVVGEITAVLHHCGAALGPDYSRRMIPAAARWREPRSFSG